MQYSNDTPIYIQIMNDIKEKIIMGEYTADMQIAPVRELAVMYEVNPNTMQRSLAELEREGYLYTKRTAGRFVIHDVQRIASLKEEMLDLKIDHFLKEVQAFSLNDEELLEMIQKRMVK